MNKLIFTFAFLLWAFLSADAQAKDNTSEHFFCAVNVQSGCHLAFNSYDYQVDASLGIKPFDGLVLAAGAGGNANLDKNEIAKEWITSAPVFFEAITYVPGKRVSPFIGLRAGYQFQFWSRYHQSSKLSLVLDKDNNPIIDWIKPRLDANGKPIVDKMTGQPVIDTSYLQASLVPADVFSPKGFYAELSIGARQKIDQHYLFYGVVAGFTQYGDGTVFYDNNTSSWAFYQDYKNYCVNSLGDRYDKLKKYYYFEGQSPDMYMYVKFKVTFEF